MKKIILLLFLISCKPTTHHEVRTSPDGKDSVAFILYFDGKQYNQFYIPFPAFKTVFESGGYEGCYEYYLDNELPIKAQSKYATYK